MNELKLFITTVVGCSEKVCGMRRLGNGHDEGEWMTV